MQSTVLITGTNRGLGLSLVKQFLDQGFKIYSLSRSHSEALKELEQAHPDQLTCYLADVTEESQVAKIASDLTAQDISLEILINNAAVHLDHSRLDIQDLDGESILKTLHINSVSPLLVIKHFLPIIEKLIVNISSEAGSIENCQRDRQYGYCMSKAALNMASKILHNRLQNQGLKVIAVHPQWFSSDMGGEKAPITPDQAAEMVRKVILQERDKAGPIFIDGKTGERIPW